MLPGQDGCWLAGWQERHTFPFFSQEAGNFVLWHRWMTVFPFLRACEAERMRKKSPSSWQRLAPTHTHSSLHFKTRISSVEALLPVPEPHVCSSARPRAYLYRGPSGPLQPISNRKSCHAQPRIRSSSRSVAFGARYRLPLPYLTRNTGKKMI